MMRYLVELQLVFKDGSTTAGNSCQVSDGVGSVLLMKRSIAVQKGVPILGVFKTFTAVAVDLASKGVGLAAVIPANVKAVNLELACPNKLELDLEKVNANGGATSGRCVAAQLHEMKRHGKDCRFGVISICIGSGMGAVAVFEMGDAVDYLCDPGTFTAIGVDPTIMGVGPATAIPATVKVVSLELGDIDLSEINEAFASQFSLS
nr:3-ketoacyl-coa thiolase 1, peroxisomal [Quercus suber]